MKKQTAVVMLAALAQEHRLAIFRLLVKRGPAGHTPGAVATRLGIPSPTLSFHLKTLERAGLVRAQRNGRFIQLSADFAAMDALVGFLTENCCGRSGAATVCVATPAPVAKATGGRRAS